MNTLDRHYVFNCFHVQKLKEPIFVLVRLFVVIESANSIVKGINSLLFL